MANQTAVRFGYPDTLLRCGLSIPDPGWPALPLLAEAREISVKEREDFRKIIRENW